MDGKRLADEAVYLAEDRFATPKHVFKVIGDLIEARPVDATRRVLDVGCATGEMLHYLAGRFPGARFNGIDVSEKLIARARTRDPLMEFAIGSALDPDCFRERCFDVIVSTGLLSILDEPGPFIRNLLAVAVEGASIFVSSPFNMEPIDLITRYRRADRAHAEWETGWNIWSRQTLERILKESPYRLTWSWVPWDLPFAVAKSDDPMRSWTFPTAEKPHQRTVAGSLLLNSCVLCIRVGGVAAGAGHP